MAAELIYVLCIVASATAAFLLGRAYRATRSRLLACSALCFAGLALNNVVLFVDLVVVPDVDLTVVRSSIALGSLLVLLFGLVWEAP